MSTPGITQSAFDLADRPSARVGVVADTHVGEWRAELPPEVLRALAGVDIILHAGDITDPAVLDELARIAPVVAVQGDHDRAAGLVLPRAQVVTVAGRRIGLTHGRRSRRVELIGGLLSLISGRVVLAGFHRALRRRFGAVDCIVHGHLHLPEIRTIRGVLFFSPGAVHNPEHSPGFAAGGLIARRYLRFRRKLDAAASAPAVGIIDIDAGGMDPKVIPIAA